MNNRRCSVKRSLKSLDIYAKPIQLTYKGNEKYRTSLGGCFSMIVLLFLLSLFLYYLQEMVLRKKSQVKKNSLVSISNQYTAPEVLSDKNVTFAFMLSNYWGEGSFDDPYYGKFTLQQNAIYMRQNATDGTSYRDFNSQEIPFSKCELGRNIFYDNEDEIKLYGIKSYYCPDWQNLTIQGNWYSPEYKVLNLQYTRCYDDTCATDEEFDAWFKKITIQEFFISSYFDVTDYDKPIHYYIDDAYVSLHLGRNVEYLTFFKRNYINLEDKLFGLFQDKVVDTFYSRSHSEYFTTDVNEGPRPGLYFDQDFKLAKDYDIYEREVYTIVGVLQDVGGFYNSLFFIGLLIYSRFQKTLYFSSLINKLYQVEQTKELAPNKRINNYSEDDESSISSFRRSQRGNPSSSNNLSQDIIKKIKQNQDVDSNLRKTLTSYIVNRWRINLNARNIISISIKKMFGCSRSKIIPQQHHFNIKQSKQELFMLGERKLMEDFDCINLLQKLRQFSIIKSLFLSKQQKFFMKFSQKNLINRNKINSTYQNLIQEYQELPKQAKKSTFERTIENILSTFKELSKKDRKVLLEMIPKSTIKSSLHDGNEYHNEDADLFENDGKDSSSKSQQKKLKKQETAEQYIVNSSPSKERYNEKKSYNQVNIFQYQSAFEIQQNIQTKTRQSINPRNAKNPLDEMEQIQQNSNEITPKVKKLAKKPKKPKINKDKIAQTKEQKDYE